MDSDFDQDLARAKALSLETQNNDNLDDDMDEEFQAQLRQAIEESKAATNTRSPPPDTSTVQTTTTTNSFLSERAKLEKERLERQKQIRKAKGLDTSDDESSGKKRKIDEDDGEEEWEEEDEPSSNKSSTAGSSGSSTGNVNGTTGEELFWNGEIRPIAVQGSEPRKDKKPTFRLTQILGKQSDISLVILSTYALDLPWLYSLYDPSVPVVLVTHPLDKGTRATVKNVMPNWIRTTPEIKGQGGYGCMHMKFMLIFYKSGRLRVAVTTANLVDYDWRDIENAAWVQDIAALTSSSHAKSDTKSLESFQHVFKRVLDGLNVQPALDIMRKQGHPSLPLPNTSDLVTRWDWSRVKVSLVPSMSGRHEGWPAVLGNGHTRLMKAIRNMGCRTGTNSSVSSFSSPSASRTKSSSASSSSQKEKIKSLAVQYLTSSTGQYSSTWLNEFFYSARGESPEDWLDLKLTGKGATKTRWSVWGSGTSGGPNKGVSEQELSIVYPSRDRVRESRFGERSGGTTFCTRKNWDSGSFPREMFRQSKSLAGGQGNEYPVMHTKMCIGVLSDPPKKKDTAQAKGKTKPTTAAANSKTRIQDKGKGKAKAPDPDIIDLVDSDSDSDAIISVPTKTTIPNSQPARKTKTTADKSETESETETETESDSSSDGLEIVDPPVGWVYLGSHNFTPSAWGTVSGSAFNPVLNIRNYELGIVFPVRSRAEIDRLSLFERPLERYKQGDIAWIQEESVHFR
ncbi:hypothetical protein VKT23_014702 [Stygiomarasmius scandens]|uniref:Phospholipase D/nuclease n=1 Tax=Marasmiellus scandens TaxID=2682957 RepID=A0ABR1IZW8_9AGAR